MWINSWLSISSERERRADYIYEKEDNRLGITNPHILVFITHTYVEIT